MTLRGARAETVAVRMKIGCILKVQCRKPLFNLFDVKKAEEVNVWGIHQVSYAKSFELNKFLISDAIYGYMKGYMKKKFSQREDFPDCILS